MLGPVQVWVQVRVGWSVWLFVSIISWMWLFSICWDTFCFVSVCHTWLFVSKHRCTFTKLNWKEAAHCLGHLYIQLKALLVSYNTLDSQASPHIEEVIAPKAPFPHHLPVCESCSFALKQRDNKQDHTLSYFIVFRDHNFFLHQCYSFFHGNKNFQTCFKQSWEIWGFPKVKRVYSGFHHLFIPKHLCVSHSSIFCSSNRWGGVSVCQGGVRLYSSVKGSKKKKPVRGISLIGGWTAWPYQENGTCAPPSWLNKYHLNI